MKTPVNPRFIEELEAYGNHLGTITMPDATADYYEYDGWYEVVTHSDSRYECNQLTELPETL
jgi:hypothetical protein